MCVALADETLRSAQGDGASFALLPKISRWYISTGKDIAQKVLGELVSLGLIGSLLEDNSVTEVMVNGPRQVYVERKGKVTLADTRFLNDEHAIRD